MISSFQKYRKNNFYLIAKYLDMSQLSLIIKNEYLTDVRNKSFWIGTLLVPVFFIGFSIFIGFMMQDTESLQKMSNPTATDPNDLSGIQVLGMLTGIFLAMFLMIYGAQIFNKVKKEKCNRIMEVLATSVTGRTMMLGKIISVALVGLTQLMIWLSMIVFCCIAISTIFKPDIPWDKLMDMRVFMAMVWSVLFFVGGYIFYGAIYAACGAMTDKDNENQGYMTLITFLLLGSFYIGQYAAAHPDNGFVIFCSFFPFTAPTIAAVNAIAADSVPLWQTLISVISLYLFATLSVVFAGKIYTASLLLKGKKFTPKDLILFMKMK